MHVCVFNLCRSVFAERLMRQELQLRDQSASFEVVSAGTQAVPGKNMPADVQRILEGRGADPSGFTVSRLTPGQIDAASLVLAATTAVRDEVIALVPHALGKTFALKEFTRLGQTVQSGLTGDVHAMRQRAAYTAPGLDDVADPPAKFAAFQLCAAEIASAVTETVELLCRKD